MITATDATTSVPLEKREDHSRQWTFLTNHAHVLVCLSQGEDETLRAIALRIGITERAVQHIMADLEGAGIITRQREGRRNRYRVNSQAKLRHDLEAHKTVGDLMEMVNVGSEKAPRNDGDPVAQLKSALSGATR